MSVQMNNLQALQNQLRGIGKDHVTFNAQGGVVRTTDGGFSRWCGRVAAFFASDSQKANQKICQNLLQLIETTPELGREYAQFARDRLNVDNRYDKGNVLTGRRAAVVLSEVLEKRRADNQALMDSLPEKLAAVNGDFSVRGMLHGNTDNWKMDWGKWEPGSDSLTKRAHYIATEGLTDRTRNDFQEVMNQISRDVAAEVRERYAAGNPACSQSEIRELVRKAVQYQIYNHDFFGGKASGAALGSEDLPKMRAQFARLGLGEITSESFQATAREIMRAAADGTIRIPGENLIPHLLDMTRDRLVEKNMEKFFLGSLQNATWAVRLNLGNNPDPKIQDVLMQAVKRDPAWAEMKGRIDWKEDKATHLERRMWEFTQSYLERVKHELQHTTSNPIHEPKLPEAWHLREGYLLNHYLEYPKLPASAVAWTGSHFENVSRDLNALASGKETDADGLWNQLLAQAGLIRTVATEEFPFERIARDSMGAFAHAFRQQDGAESPADAARALEKMTADMNGRGGRAAADAALLANELRMALTR